MGKPQGVRASFGVNERSSERLTGQGHTGLSSLAASIAMDFLRSVKADCITRHIIKALGAGEEEAELSMQAAMNEVES